MISMISFVYEADEWYNSCDGQRYDDVLKVTVNLDHPDHPLDDEKLYEDLEGYWSKGINNVFIISHCINKWSIIH